VVLNEPTHLKGLGNAAHEAIPDGEYNTQSFMTK